MIDTCGRSKVWFCADVRLTWKRGNPLFLLPLTGGSGAIIVCSLHHTCTTCMLLTHDAEQAHLSISDGFYFEELPKNWTLSVQFDASAKIFVEVACYKLLGPKA